MIEKIPDQIPVQTGEWGETTFDIIPKETFGMACRKINELVDAVNGILDYAPLEMAQKAEPANIELERTRKALEVAIDTFNWIDETYRTGQETEAEIWGKVQLAAQEITALEQKE